MQKKFSCTLSDLLYYVRQKNPGVILKLNSMVQSVGQLDFVPPVQSPEDIRGTSWKDWEYLLQELILHGTYEAVVIDMGNGIEELFQMLDLCKFIYMPICVDPVSKSKIRQFENLLNARDYSEVSEKTVKMKLPFCTVESRRCCAARATRSSSASRRFTTISRSCRWRITTSCSTTAPCAARNPCATSTAASCSSARSSASPLWRRATCIFSIPSRRSSAASCWRPRNSPTRTRPCRSITARRWRCSTNLPTSAPKRRRRSSSRTRTPLPTASRCSSSCRRISTRRRSKTQPSSSKTWSMAR